MVTRQVAVMCAATIAVTGLAGCGSAASAGSHGPAAPPAATVVLASNKVTAENAQTAPSTPNIAAVSPKGKRASVVYEWAQFGGGLLGAGSVAPVAPAAAAPLGLGPVRRTALVVPGLKGTITQVATSNSDDYALTRRGAVYAWGAGSQGELGNGTRKQLQRIPVRVQFPAGVRIVSLPNPMPYNAGMAIAANGTVWAWGNDRAREFCRPHGSILTTPVRVRLHRVSLAVGALRHALYDAGGRIVSCGSGPVGQLGNGTSGVGADTGRPVAVKGLPSGRVTALTSAWGNAGVLMADGRYYDWGYNQGGQVGNGATRNATTAVHVLLPHPVRQVFQGGSYGNNGQTIVILRNGALWEWGVGNRGQLGNGLRANATLPVRLKLPDASRPVSVNSGGSTNYVVDHSGHLWAWGDNSVGQLGNGSTKRVQLTPIQDPVTVTQVASTAHNVVALATPRG